MPTVAAEGIQKSQHLRAGAAKQRNISIAEISIVHIIHIERESQSGKRSNENTALRALELNKTVILFLFHSQDLSEIKNRFIRDTQNSNGKRTVPFAGFDEQQIKEDRIASERPPTVPYTNKKLRSMMTDRQEKTDK